MKKRALFLLLAFAVFAVSFTLLLRADPDPDAHYIIGYVHNASDGKSPNGMKVIAYRQSNPSDNVTDIIGPLGNSGVSNEYMIDCQMLQSTCQVGDIFIVRVPLRGGYAAGPVNVTITPGGFDVAPDMTLVRVLSIAIPRLCPSLPACR